MRIPAAWLKRFAAPLALCGAVVALTQPVAAQTDRELVRLDRRLRNLIRSIDEIKWQNITIYKLEEEFASRLKRNMEAEDAGDVNSVEAICQTIADDPLSDCFNTILRLASSARTGNGRNYNAFKLLFAQNYGLDPDDLDDTELQKALATVLSVKARRESRPKEFYLVTSREKTPPRLIAMLGVNQNETTGEPMMVGNPWVGTELYRTLSTNGPDSTMYDELKGAVADNTGGVSNQMFVLRDLSKITIGARTMARASDLDADTYQYVLTSISTGRPLRSNYQAPAEVEDSLGGEDTQAGGMFSQGADPFADFLGGAKDNTNRVEGAEIPKTTETPYEMSVGTDVLVSIVNYKLNDKKKAPETEWGVELVNGFDQINYPSIWGGRLTLNALLENVKIGMVLPQYFLRMGDSTIASSGIGSSPQKIVDGYGIAMSGDFVAPLLDNSGLFNFFATYTFTDPQTDKMLLRTFNSSTPRGIVQPGEQGYLIRFAAQAYYSFGFFLDDQARHLFRLKVGGTVYGVDTYVRQQDTSAQVGEGVPDAVMAKLDSKTAGGIAGKIEYMKGGQKIPYGASIQYVDQSLLSDLWLQFIVSPTLDLKVGLKYFAPIFRGVDAHPWENDNIVVPSVNLKYHFGL
jgi:hypothetical protein